MGRGHSPFGRAATMLIAVAYAHVLLDLAGAVLAIPIAVRLLGRPARDAIGDRCAPGGFSIVRGVRPRPSTGRWMGQRGGAGSRPSRTQRGVLAARAATWLGLPVVLGASKRLAGLWKHP
jgi:hypothetical protein